MTAHLALANISTRQQLCPILNSCTSRCCCCCRWYHTCVSRLARLAFSPIQSLEMRRSAKFMLFKNVVRRISKLRSCEKIGMVARWAPIYPHTHTHTKSLSHASEISTYEQLHLLPLYGSRLTGKTFRVWKGGALESGGN